MAAMKVSIIALFFCALFCGNVFGVTRVFLIDSFTVDSPALLIITNGVSQTVENFVDSTTIIGNERDLSLTSLSGNNVVISAGVSSGTFSSAAPKGGTGTSLLQYDGIDGTVLLNPSGLNGEDFTQSGGFAMRVNITADIGTNVIFRVYSGNANNFCQFTQAIPGNSLAALYTLQYSKFTNVGSGCNFANVGALEIEVDLAENVDITVDTIEVISNNPSPTPSKSRAPASPSNSRTRTPSRSRVPASASNTRTPSRSRAPASASNTRTPSRSRVPASASNTRTPSRSRAPASASNTRTPSRSRNPASASNTRTPSRSRAPASASNTRTPSRSRIPASASHTRTPTRSRIPASPSRTRTPTRSRVPASPSHTRTPTRSRVPASPSNSRTRTPTRSRIPASPSRTRSPSQIPRSPSRTPSPSNCVCTCPELECYMFKYGEYTFKGNVARNVNEFAVEGQQAINEEEEGFDFLKFF